jgi:protein-S-isoprenylcysteine O-methyltransferase Ste14
MRKASAVLGSALFFVVAPCLAAGLVPWWISRWELRAPFLGAPFTRGIGVLLVLAGVPGIVDSFRRFALEGLGTPAPIAPPEKLVVTGAYRYVRNPMYVAAVSIILGQALLFADWRLLLYAGLFWLACHAFVVVYEEPTLQRSFGAAYATFCANVPRWIPRLSPWRAP